MQLRQVLRMQPSSISSSIRSFASVAPTVVPTSSIGADGPPVITTGKQLRQQHSIKYGPYAGRFRDVTKHGRNPLTVSQLAMRPSGSMLFRCEMIDGVEDAKEYIVENVMNDFTALVHNESGALLVSTVMEYGSDEQKQAIIKEVLDNVHAFATHQFASFTVSKAIEYGHAAEVSALMTASPENIDMYFKDPFAAYVLGNLIQYGTQADRELIGGAMKGYALELSKTEATTFIAQKICQFLEPGVLRVQLIGELLLSSETIFEMGESEFGNYVVQNIVEYGSESEKQTLLDALKGNVMSLAVDEFGSHVIQRFSSFPEAQFNELISEITSSPENLLTCSTNEYGGYVVQMIMKEGSDADKAAVFEVLKSNAVQLALNPYGRFVLQKSRKVFDEDRCSELFDVLVQNPEDIKRCIADKYANMVYHFVVDEGTLSQRNAVIEAVINSEDIAELCTHSKKGQYVVQSMIKRKDLTEEQRAKLISSLLSPPEQASKIVMNKYGGYVVQSIVETGSPAERSLVFASLKDKLFAMFEHRNASFCVTKLAKVLIGEDRAEIVQKLIGTQEAVVRLACDENSNYTLNEFISSGVAEEQTLILAGLTSNAAVIACDEHGIFCMLRALEVMSPAIKAELIAELLKDTDAITHLARHARGKRVLRYILEKGSNEEAKLINDALQTISSD